MRGNNLLFMKATPITHILSDIEGTTTPISFVKDELFPYILENLDAFLEKHWEEPAVQDILEGLVDQSLQDEKQGFKVHYVPFQKESDKLIEPKSSVKVESTLPKSPIKESIDVPHSPTKKNSESTIAKSPVKVETRATSPVKVENRATLPIKTSSESKSPIKETLKRKLDSFYLEKSFLPDIVLNVQDQMRMDRKAGPLKALQGYMWASAYQHGTIKGMVYDDVIKAFKRWKKQGKSINIYSSGSIKAQKLLFMYSTHGDLLSYFDHHFDTTSGSKLESSSYVNIAHDLKVDPSKVLFLSDNVHELEAASTAGMQVQWLIRPGNADAETGFKPAYNFDSISP